MSEFNPSGNNGPSVPEHVNPDESARHELLELYDADPRLQRVGAATVHALTPTEQRYKAESEARGGSPYFPAPLSQEQMDKAAKHGFDLSKQSKY